MTRAPRAFYVAYEFALAVLSLFSRVVNAVFYGGSMNQTLSSRAHVMADLDPNNWRKTRRWINRLFFFQDDHCASAWAAELKRARKTVSYAEMIEGE